MATEQQVNSADEFYGAGATTGSTDDAMAALADQRGLDIKDGNRSEQVSLSGEQGIRGDESGSGAKGTEQGAEDSQKQSAEDTTGDTSDTPDTDKDGDSKGGLEQSLDKHVKAASTMADKGIDLGSIVEEFNTKGALGEDTLKAIEKAGYSKEIIEGYVNAQNVLADQYTNAVYDSVGGEAEYTNMVNWAASNLSRSEKQAFNQAVDSGNLSAVNIMLSGIKARMTDARGTRNSSIVGGKSTTTGRSGGFATKADLVAAMSDKRYGRDPTYTHEVEQKVAKTNF